MGVTLFFMLTGQTPYAGTDFKSIIKNVVRNEPNWDILTQNNISQPTFDVLKKFLNKDPVQRIDLSDALVEPWIISNCKTPNPQNLCEVAKNLTVGNIKA